jgi:hypothetical protein
MNELKTIQLPKSITEQLYKELHGTMWAERLRQASTDLNKYSSVPMRLITEVTYYLGDRVITRQIHRHISTERTRQFNIKMHEMIRGVK